MRLVRVTTNDPECIFNGNLSADLVIEPESRLALKSLSLEQQDSIVDIKFGNDQIVYSQGGTPYEVTLNHAVYTVNDFNLLLNDIQDNFNLSAAYVHGVGSPYIQGMEYRVGTDEQHRFQFHARKGQLGEWPDYWVYDNAIDYDDNTHASNEYSVPNIMVDGEAFVMKVNERMPDGNGYCSALASVLNFDGTISDQTASGFWICATNEDISAYTPAEMKAFVEDPAARVPICKWGIGVQRLNTGDFRYLSILDGVASTIADTAAGYTPNDLSNPWVRLQRSAGRIYGFYNDSTGSGVTNIGAVATTEEVRQFIVFWNDAVNCVIGMTELSMSAFDSVPRVESLELDFVDREIANPGDVLTSYKSPRGMLAAPPNIYAPDYTKTNNALTFESLTMAQAFGFKVAQIPPGDTYSSVNFVATGPLRFGPRIVADTLIVLSENLPLLSYDTTKTGTAANGQARSILDVVPLEYGNEGIVAYQPSVPTFIDLHNASKIGLRNIQLRIVDGYYEPVKLMGIGSAVLLIKGPNEN